MMIADITNLPKNNKTYNGNTRKHGITVDGTDYIVKFPKENDMSVYCEYAASNFIRSLGIPCHEVSLGLYKGITVDIIRDFTSGEDVSLHSYKDTRQSSEDTDIGNKEYTYEDVLYLIDKHLKMTEPDKLEAKRQFWRMFICDAITANRDRHWGNWGYMKYNGSYKHAPLYDNGACLYPGVANVIGQYADVSTRKQFLYDRTFLFPASLFRIKKPDRTYRSNYADMFQDVKIDRIFSEQTELFQRKITYQNIFNSMSGICTDMPLDSIYKRFYTEVVSIRYMCIVLRMDFEESYRIIEEALIGHEPQ